jgi:hypothetical protein
VSRSVELVGAAKGSPRLALELPGVVLAAFGPNAAVKRAVAGGSYALAVR